MMTRNAFVILKCIKTLKIYNLSIIKFITSFLFQPPVSKSIPVPNVTVTKSTPIRYTHTVGNQVISLPPSGTSGTTTTTATSTTLTSNSASTASSPAGIL